MISIVTPVFNEEKVIAAFHQEIFRVMESTGERWEIIYVDDGSSDHSLDLLLRLQQADSRITVVELSRNWGHQPALTAGLAKANGSAVVLIDADLQDPPAVIPDFVLAWKSGAQVVVGERSKRAEAGLRKLLFPAFYRVLGYLSDFPIPLNAGIFGLLDRRVADEILRLSESNRYLPGLRAWVGFRTQIIFYERAARAAGEPKQTVWKLFKYACDAIFSFSYKPLRLSLVLGSLSVASALGLGVSAILCQGLGLGFLRNLALANHISTITAVLFLSGVQLVSVGILGEYVGRIYDEVRRRPFYVVNQVHSAAELQNTIPRVQEVRKILKDSTARSSVGSVT